MDKERLNIPRPDLGAEAEEVVNRAEIIKEEVQKMKEEVEASPVQVSVAPSGQLRKNGPCPCGSGVKFKRCCLDKVNKGQLNRLTIAGRVKPIHTQYTPPKAVVRQARKDFKAEAAERAAEKDEIVIIEETESDE